MTDVGVIALGDYDTPVLSVSTAITGSDPVLELIASTDDADFVADTSNTGHTGTAFFDIGAVPADFGNMDTLAIRLRYALDIPFDLNTWDTLSAEVFRADGTTSMSDNVTLASSITTTTPTNSSVIPFTGLDTAANKAIWDTALIRIDFAISKDKGGDSVSERVFAGELTGTYTVAAAGASIPIIMHQYLHNIGR